MKAATAAAEALLPAALNDLDLKSDKASRAASLVAAIPSVRAALMKFQKDFCLRPPGGKKGAVLDGRDIGTVIAPEAPVKFFITASAEARAARRFKELREHGDAVTYEGVLADMKARDQRDTTRAASPLKAATDAITLDTSTLNADEVFAKALEIAKKKLASL